MNKDDIAETPTLQLRVIKQQISLPSDYDDNDVPVAYDNSIEVVTEVQQLWLVQDGERYLGHKDGNCEIDMTRAEDVCGPWFAVAKAEWRNLPCQY
jgi:uncharacterized protein involved in copper resistance